MGAKKHLKWPNYATLGTPRGDSESHPQSAQLCVFITRMASYKRGAEASARLSSGLLFKLNNACQSFERKSPKIPKSSHTKPPKIPKSFKLASPKGMCGFQKIAAALTVTSSTPQKLCAARYM